MTHTETIYVAVLAHEDNSYAIPRAFRATSHEEAEKRAEDALMTVTIDGYDEDYTREEWLDVCLSEGWFIHVAILE